MALNEIGSTIPCDTWTLPQNSHFREFHLGYNDEGVTYLQAVTNKNTYFERGQLQSGDSLVVQSFTLEAPLMGLQGYETKIIKALGFIRFKCAVPLPDEVLTNQTLSEEVVPIFETP